MAARLVSTMQNARRVARAAGLAGVAALAFGALAPASAPAALTITEYPLPVANGGPGSIVAGPDGALWFADAQARYIGRITTSGTATVQKALADRPDQIALGPDGALWFTMSDANKIGRLTTAGQLTTYPIPTPDAGAYDIVAGADNALWFTEIYGKRLGRIATDGTITEFAPFCGGCPGGPGNIALGPDGIWLTHPQRGLVGWTTNGSYFNFLDLAGTRPVGIARASDDTMWFTMPGANKIGRRTSGFARTTFVIPTPDSEAQEIAAAADGTMWFVERDANKIGRITPDGTIHEFPIPTADSNPFGIVAGPDGAMWFTEWGANKIGRIDTSAPPDVASEPAREIGLRTATLTGSVVANGRPTEAVFEYGVTTAYGEATAAQPAGAGLAATAVSASPAELLPGTVYHYRLVATNARGTTHGPDATFTTYAPPPGPPPKVVAPLAPIASIVNYSWSRPKRTGTVLTRVVVQDVPAGATVSVRCTGRRCPFTAKVLRHRRGTVRLTPLFRRRRLAPRTVVEVRITAPDRIGKLSRATIRKARPPALRVFCLPPNARRPSRCR